MDPSKPPPPGAVPIDPTYQAPEAMPVSWERITPEDFRKAAGLARRWCPIALRYATERGVDGRTRPECNPDIVLIDLALAHYWVGLDWDGLLRAPDDVFVRAMVMVQLAIDRRARYIPPVALSGLGPGLTARPARLNQEVSDHARRH